MPYSNFIYTLLNYKDISAKYSADSLCVVSKVTIVRKKKYTSKFQQEIANTELTTHFAFQDCSKIPMCHCSNNVALKYFSLYHLILYKTY